jgi:hypothetical protein
MTVETLTNFTRDLFYNTDGTLTAEGRSAIGGILGAVGAGAVAVGGYLWSSTCGSSLFNYCAETSMNGISYVGKRSWKIIKSQGICRVAGAAAFVTATVMVSNWAFYLPITSGLTGSVLIVGSALALSLAGNSKKRKTKVHIKRPEEEVKAPIREEKAEVRREEFFCTDRNKFEDEDDKVFELKEENSDDEMLSEIEERLRRISRINGVDINI